MSLTPEAMITLAQQYIRDKQRGTTDTNITVPAELLHTTDVYNNALNAVAREYLVGHNVIFDSDEPNILYILADIIFSKRPMMPTDTDNAATTEYIRAYEEINQRLYDAIRDQLAADENTYAQTVEHMCNVMVIDYVNSLNGVVESNNRIRLIDTFRRTVLDELRERDIAVTIHGLDEYRPLDDEMYRYGDATLVSCWVAPLQVDNHDLEGTEIASDVATLHDIINDDIDLTTAAVSDAMESLIASQGMDLTQWAKEIRTTPGAFAASLRDEVNEMTGLLMQTSFLIAQGFISITDLDSIMRGATNALCIPAATEDPHRQVPVGLFDAVTGGGSLIDIELERDWLVPCTARTLNSSFGGIHTDDKYVLSGRYGYAPSDAYGENDQLGQITAVRLPMA